MTTPTAGLTRQMLEWIAAHPRPYAEVIEAWKTSCPRLTIWEDALIDGLVRVDGPHAGDRAMVAITARGRQWLTCES